MVLRLMIEPIVRAALLEDLGRAGDITTDALVPEQARIEAVIAARQPGVVAGLDAALLAFELLDPGLRIETLRADGARVARGDAVAHIAGRARPVLAASCSPKVAGMPIVRCWCPRCRPTPRRSGRHALRSNSSSRRSA